MTLTVQQATNRLVVLTALHWFPVGLTTPVMVLLALDRGLSLADVGLLFGVYGVLLAALELPTGGLADAIGRRPVLLTAAVLHVLSCLAFAGAQGLPGFLGAIALMGVGRALLSGPLEAWYVDTVDGRADVAPGLGRQSAADGAGLAVGAVIGGALPALLGGALAAPFLVAAALDLAYVGALLRLLVEDRPKREGSLRRELTEGAQQVPATVKEAVQLSVTDGPLRVVLLLTAVGGIAIVAFELLGPLRFAELAGGREEGAAVLGTVQAVSFGAAAVGALLAARTRRLLRHSTRWTCALLSVLGAVGVACFGATSVIVLGAGAMGAYFLAHGAQWPLLSAVLHSRVASAQRATAVSAMSLAMTVGGFTGNLALPHLAEATSTRTAFAAVGGLVLLSGLLCLRLPVSRDQEALLDQALDHGDDLLGGVGLGDPGGGGEDREQLAETARTVAAGEQRGAVDVDRA
ncbi:MAG: Major Facilitator Superfamily protein [Frankiales bacterium]|nr:Major Facilitator Superfamily protein [Frankiales bacterium]